MPLCFSGITYLSFGLKLRGKSNAIKRQSLQLWKFLTDNNARWTIDRTVDRKGHYNIFFA